jgi:tetratricopeptide (TPR) repeat protein
MHFPSDPSERLIVSGEALAKLSNVSLLVLVFVLLAPAQEWSWPEKPSNLQVLPKDWSGSRLQPVMIGFTRALGVRCSYCHKGKEGEPLGTYDFASDENPNKNRAREMLRMLESINDHLKNIQPSGEKRINVWCHTCHRGRPKPTSIEEELDEQYQTKGVDSTLDYYADLKQKYYGRGIYDFGENTLNNFGYNVLGKDPKDAVEVFRLNAEEFPQSGNVWDSLAEAYMKSGNLKKAEEYYQKSLSLDASNQNAKDMLKKIQKSKQE